jgi:CYTH domain-containing protein
LSSKDKQKLQRYFKLLSSCRNISIHGSLPSFQVYDLERTVYLALNVHNIIKDHDVFREHSYSPTKADEAFLSSYDTERAERVRKNIEEAKKKSKKLKHEESLLKAEGWDVYVTKCPVCNSDGILGGSTEPWIEATVNYVEDSGLTFSADSFKCGECGLILDDTEELALAGMEVTYDRSSESDKYYEGYEPDVDDLDYER